jgi:Arc/MetJ-type ribon-helix-helix transcriptional regulator
MVMFDVVKNNNERLALRLTSEQRQQIEKLVDSGKFRNLSEVIRASLDEFFR